MAAGTELGTRLLPNNMLRLRCRPSATQGEEKGLKGARVHCSRTEAGQNKSYFVKTARQHYYHCLQAVQ